MAQILGIDTSNYTTSAALLDLETGEVHQEKQLLPVKAGEAGLRQSDAVFHHTRQLPELLERLRPFLAETAAADGFAGRILLHEDETLAPADCRICWQQGETAFCGGEKIRRLEAMLTGEKND